MFGNILNKCEEMRSKTGRPQHIHREKTVSELLREGFEEEQKERELEELEGLSKVYHTALYKYLRKGKELKTLIKKRWPLLGGCLRKD